MNPGPEPTRVFYDGGCGLCHGAVRFAARRDTLRRLRFAPLDGPTFRRTVPAEARRDLPDSLVVLTAEGAVLSRSEAILHLLGRLGSPWPAVVVALAWVPVPLRDGVYRLVARLRRRREACALIAPGDGRFEP
ncbi:thiol-disulfide oxidoreductase DCC family protein [Geothrix terrae]|uniref:thiol-disulfide oxidoreductase DCC family protein n=1 Tax=Geothrix terrae TaxID=2922720 RepID=UPI001FAE105E|nr:DUF393 domain-containing protein [Geothrix terrae]